MPKHMVMDHTGHTEHVWDKADVIKVEEAEARFAELTGKGFKAIVPGVGGEPGEIVRSFDSDVEELLFVPPLAGG